jgi:two-component system nitrate/nitrite response regulator NarL
MQKKVRLLIVDDQQHARRSLKALLATKFQLVDTCEAANGIEALQCARDCKPDIILMDVRMPEMDGIEAIRTIKAENAQTPIIALSMYPGYRDTAIAAGASAFFSKGESPEQLLAVLNDMLNPASRKE